MGTVSCRSCKGSGRFYAKSGKAFDCNACGGTGVNKNLWSTRCERCRAEIIYKAHSNTPRFCKNCRSIDLTKNCGQYGCTNTIRYKVGWDNVPTYCKRCETKRSEGWSASTCSGTGLFGCGKLIWSPPGKRFNLCQDCSARKKAEGAAKWRTKSCKGCGSEVRYHVDWKNVPDLCKSCKEKEKEQWREKSCADCGAKIRYHVDWKNVPDFCKSCKEKRRAKITRDPRGNYRVEVSDGTYFTFGRVTEPPAKNKGGQADIQREWARKKYWWLAAPGKDHETFIFDRKPVDIERGELQINANLVDVKYSSKSLQRVWGLFAIAVINAADYDF